VSNHSVENPWALYRPAQRWLFLAILFLVSTSNYIDRQVVSILIEPIKREYALSDSAMGLLSGFAFAAVYALLGIPVARLADRGNRKVVITATLAVWSCMTVLCGLVRSFPQLLLARVGVGTGEAGATPPAQSLIADYFPPDQRARALGIFMSSATVGYLVAFTIGARLAADHGWRAAFIALGAPGLLLCLLTWFGLSEPRSTLGRRNEEQESLGLALRTLAAKRTYVLLCLSAVLYWLVAYGALIWFPTYLLRVMNLDLAAVGTVYGSVAAAGALMGSVLGGLIMDAATRRGPKASVCVPAVILIGAAPVYEVALLSNSLAIFLIGSLIGGFAIGTAGPALFSILHRVCGSPRRAIAVAILLSFANLIGLGLGPVITGALSDALSASYGPVGLRYALMISILILVPAGAILWAASGSIEQDIEQ
jgi:MFS family permease